MSHTVTQQNRRQFDSLFWGLVGLALGGVGVSAYLMWGYTVPGATLSCGGSHGCETVKNSVYAQLLGIPLPIIGIVAFSALLILIILQKQINQGVSAAYLSLALFGFSFAGVLYSAYLTYLEIFVIEAICRWCVASATIMVLIFALSIINLRQYQVDVD